MPAEVTGMGTYKCSVHIGKWNDGRTPEDGEPDEVVTTSEWIENGEVVTDPKRIAELEARIAEGDGWHSQPQPQPLLPPI